MKNNTERFKLKIENIELLDVYDSLDRLVVEIDEDLAAMFKMYLPIYRKGSKWNYLDDPRLALWKRVQISAGLSIGTEPLFSGYITHVRPYFAPKENQCYLEIWGLDESVKMDREEKLKAWPNQDDGDIARQIFGTYGFSTANVKSAGVMHDEKVSTTVQRESDMMFLKRLAKRNGFECFVKNGSAYFRKPDLFSPSQGVLPVHFGKNTVVNRFSVDVNGLQPSKATMVQVDRLNKQVLDADVMFSKQKPMGVEIHGSHKAPGVSPGSVVMNMNAAAGKQEMEKLCEATVHNADWYVTAEGELNGNLYGDLLEVGRKVTVKGVGKTHSGEYYVTRVVHTFSRSGPYLQYFRLKRNALQLTGSEMFTVPGI